MQVRHNTSLLEQAIDHVVRRASIPLIAAEAAAAEKKQRAQGFRRLATGAAMALVAVGIGFGIYLSKRVDEHKIVDSSPPSTVPLPRQDAGENAPADVAAKDNSQISPSENASQEITPPGPPSIVTTNFTIFRDKTIKLFGRDWEIQAGHEFKTEADQQSRNWSYAWCYTINKVDGLDVRIPLGYRQTSSEVQSAPNNSSLVLSKVGLTAFETLTLATNCPWLDGKAFDIEILSGGNAATNSNFKLDGTVLIFNGEIKSGFANSVSRYEFEKLQINSPGGLIDEAIRTGNWLRSNRKIVEAKEECLSACIFVLAGGISRQAEDLAHIGVHRFYKTAGADIGDTEAAQQKSAEILEFLQSMGIKNELWFAMAKTPSASMQYIEHKKLRFWGLLSAQTIEVPDDPFESSSETSQPKNDLDANQESITNPSPTASQPRTQISGEELIRLEGFDAPGSDFPEMPVLRLSEDECRRLCLSADSCLVVTYNVQSRACFLKSQVFGTTPFPSAVTYYRKKLHGKF